MKKKEGGEKILRIITRALSIYSTVAAVMKRWYYLSRATSRFRRTIVSCLPRSIFTHKYKKKKKEGQEELIVGIAKYNFFHKLC